MIQGEIIVRVARLLALVPLTLLGCQTPPLAPAEPEPVPLAEISPEPPGLCLAFSGGGIRAGAVALGVLQELQLTGRLEDFDLVASVSGGGYPIFGLLWELQDPEAAVADLLSPEGAYITGVEAKSTFIGDPMDELILSVLFEPLYAVFRLLWSVLPGSAVLGTSASQTYGGSITTTFAPVFEREIGTPPTRPPMRGIRTDGLPTPIFVASSSKGMTAPKVGHSYGAADLFELSPKWIGSETTGYWSEYGDDLDLVDAIVMSGAAVDTPSHEHGEPIPDWARLLGFYLGKSVYLPRLSWTFLSDGGFIENLALLPLIRRGCREIFALDASSDPELLFQSLDTLLGYLPGPPDLDLVVGADPGEDGWHLRRHILRFSIGRAPNEVAITLAKLGIDLDSLSDYPEAVRSFVQSLATLKRSGCCGEGIEQRCAFPLESTFRQEFTTPEFRAYRELGRHLVNEAQLAP